MEVQVRSKWRLAGDGRELAMWSAGLLCGLGVAAANQALLPLTLALAGGLPVVTLALRRLRRPRAVVWEEPSWRMP